MKADKELLNFTRSKASRDKLCINKDAIKQTLISSMDFKHKKNFKALLMPSEYGEEVYTLIHKGIPPENIFCIEQKVYIHKEIQTPTKEDRLICRGIQTTEIPLSAEQALGRAYGLHSPEYDLIDLDFLGKPSFTHYEKIIKKIFKLKFLKSDSLFLLTFGKARSTGKATKFNSTLLEFFKDENVVATEEFCKVALLESRHPLAKIRSFMYYSKGGNNGNLRYLTTVLAFGKYKKLI